MVSMDDLLPSYESAIRKDPWTLVAPYLRSNDLCSAAIVCRKWHATFTPKLWGNPASHFGVENDTVYVALTRFKRTLPFVRLLVRELTHTLHFPPAHAELYDGPHAEWLRDCLEYLPHLQCLVVDGLPFFDHASLLSLRYASPRWRSSNSNNFPVFALRLLDASFCKNATPKGLTEALLHFPQLVSLDLSGTIAAKSTEVLTILGRLHNLRVLCLKNLALKDADFSIIARSIKTRVRSLDVSGNQLTDVGIGLLLEHCFQNVSIERHDSPNASNILEQRPEEAMNPYSNDNLVGGLRKRLMEGFVGSLTIEHSVDIGITHLYLSRNPITVEGIAGLLQTGRLQVLDIGLLAVISNTHDDKSPGVTNRNLEPPSMSKLVPLISKHASTKLQYLRVNYELMTKDVPLEAASPTRAELSGDSFRGFELETTEAPMPELEATETAVFEVPGDLSFPAELPASLPNEPSLATSPVDAQNGISQTKTLLQTPTVAVTVNPPEVNRGAAFAPEPVHLDSPLGESSLHAGNRDSGPNPARNPHYDSSTLSPISPCFEPGSANLMEEQMRAQSPCGSFYYVEDRRAQLDLRQSNENCLHPGNLARLHTLVLTGVPASTTDKAIIHRIIQYIIDAAEETSIATKRARHTYILPPGRSRAIAEREYVSSLFALRRIVLEIASPPATAPKNAPSSWRASPTKSSTEDADSEAFWEAATYDFSFFNDEECGLPNREPGRALPLAAMSGLELATSSPTSPLLQQQRTVEPERLPVLDVVGEIGKFRRDRKAAYENLIQMGDTEPDVPGYWPGDITVLRPASAEAGELDCYGNRFESGWLYR